MVPPIMEEGGEVVAVVVVDMMVLEEELELVGEAEEGVSVNSTQILQKQSLELTWLKI